MKLNTYQKVATITVLATIFLIFVGGLVRASGAGLGCPDWPKCFGMWIPPTTAWDLPPQFEASQFNVTKTWTEYINRLIGAIIGLLITATFALSFRYRKSKPAVFYSSFMALVLVLFQGWLGGQVVKTGLNEGLITLHMVLAMAIMAVLLYGVFKATSNYFRFKVDPEIQNWLYWTGIVLLALTVVQMVLGTQVREAVDVVKNSAQPPPRGEWLNQVGIVDEVHRSFSWTVVLSGLAVFYLGFWKSESPVLIKLSGGIMALILIQIGFGVGLYYFEMPPAFQVMHLSIMALLFCLEFLLLLVLRLSKKETEEELDKIKPTLN